MQNNNQKVPGQDQNNNQVPKQGGLSWSQPFNANAGKGNQPAPASMQFKPSTPMMPRQTTPTLPYTKRQEPKAGKNRFLKIIAGGVLLGFAVGWAWYTLRPSSEEGKVITGGDASGSAATIGTSAGTGASPVVWTGSGTGVTAPAGIQAQPGDLLTTPTPQQPGLKVLVSSIKVSVPTWVVVYETKNGVRANALGAVLLFPTSPNTPFSVSLLRATAPNQTYFVGRSVDDGDKIFSMQSDRPVIDTSGKPVYMTFKTQ